MKKAGIVAFIVFLISCGPVNDSPWPFYELVYSTTVQTHNTGHKLQLQLEELLSAQKNDTIIHHPEQIKTLNDSNLALVERIEYAINVLNNAPEGDAYAETKSAAINILKAQQVYHNNSYLAVLWAFEDSVISQKDQITFLIMRESRTALNNQYAKWQETRDNYIKNLELTEGELINLEAKYGSDK